MAPTVFEVPGRNEHPCGCMGNETIVNNVACSSFCGCVDSVQRLILVTSPTQVPQSWLVLVITSSPYGPAGVFSYGFVMVVCSCDLP